MSDPIHDLEHFNEQGLTVNPLPAAEVRRRGNRMRRRNNAVAAIAGVAAVAIVAVPLGMYAANGDGRSLEPPPLDPGPSRTTESTVEPQWRQQIPAGFPLAEGLLPRNGDGSPVRVTDD